MSRLNCGSQRPSGSKFQIDGPATAKNVHVLLKNLHTSMSGISSGDSADDEDDDKVSSLAASRDTAVSDGSPTLASSSPSPASSSSLPILHHIIIYLCIITIIIIINDILLHIKIYYYNNETWQSLTGHQHLLPHLHQPHHPHHSRYYISTSVYNISVHYHHHYHQRWSFHALCILPLATTPFQRLLHQSGTVCRSRSGCLRRCKFSAADSKPYFLPGLSHD